MSTRKISEPVSDDRRRNRNVSATIEFPNFFPTREIICPDVMPPIHQNLRLVAHSSDRWRAPRWDIFARRFPQLLAVGPAVNCEEGIRQHVAQHDDLIVVNHW